MSKTRLWLQESRGWLKRLASLGMVLSLSLVACCPPSAASDSPPPVSEQPGNYVPVVSVSEHTPSPPTTRRTQNPESPLQSVGPSEGPAWLETIVSDLPWSIRNFVRGLVLSVEHGTRNVFVPRLRNLERSSRNFLPEMLRVIQERYGRMGTVYQRVIATLQQDGTWQRLTGSGRRAVRRAFNESQERFRSAASSVTWHAQERREAASRGVVGRSPRVSTPQAVVGPQGAGSSVAQDIPRDLYEQGREQIGRAALLLTHSADEDQGIKVKWIMNLREWRETLAQLGQTSDDRRVASFYCHENKCVYIDATRGLSYSVEITPPIEGSREIREIRVVDLGGVILDTELDLGEGRVREPTPLEMEWIREKVELRFNRPVSDEDLRQRFRTELQGLRSLLHELTHAYHDSQEGRAFQEFLRVLRGTDLYGVINEGLQDLRRLPQYSDASIASEFWARLVEAIGAVGLDPQFDERLERLGQNLARFRREGRYAAGADYAVLKLARALLDGDLPPAVEEWLVKYIADKRGFKEFRNFYEVAKESRGRHRRLRNQRDTGGDDSSGGDSAGSDTGGDSGNTGSGGSGGNGSGGSGGTGSGGGTGDDGYQPGDDQVDFGGSGLDGTGGSGGPGGSGSGGSGSGGSGGLGSGGSSGGRPQALGLIPLSGSSDASSIASTRTPLASRNRTTPSPSRRRR